MNCILGLMFLISVVLSINPADSEWIISKNPDQELADSYVAPSNVSYVREVPANEILEKIKSGDPVNYSHTIIKGDIGLNHSEMPTKYIGWSIVEFKKGSDEEYTKILDPRKKTVVDSSINISDCLVMGDIYFDNAIFQRANISFNNTEILGSSSFSNSFFNGSAYFVNTKFNGSASFRDSAFNESAFFVYSTFKGPTDFIGVGFHGFTSFLNSKFNRLVDFRAANFYFVGYWTSFEGSEFRNVSFGDFNEGVSFLNSTFKGDALFGRFGNFVSFEDSEFKGNVTFNFFFWPDSAIFSGAQFHHSADFDNSIFYQYADFSEAQFNQSSNFSSSDFRGFANFSKTQFNKSAFFNRSNFNNSATFEGCQCNNSFDFTYAKGKDYISFERARIASANFNWAKFSGDLFFEGSEIDRLNLTRAKFGNIFLKRKNVDHLDLDEVAYLSLIGNLRRTNFIDDANQFYYSYRDSRRGNLNTLYGSLDYFLMLFYGYGLKPERPVIWGFIFTAIFAAIFYWRQGIIPVRQGEPEEETNRFTLAEAAAFSAMTFLSGGKLVFDPPEYRIAPGRPWRDVQICKALFVWERLMGMILIVMFAIAVSKTIILGS